MHGLVLQAALLQDAAAVNAADGETGYAPLKGPRLAALFADWSGGLASLRAAERSPAAAAARVSVASGFSSGSRGDAAVRGIAESASARLASLSVSGTGPTAQKMTDDASAVAHTSQQQKWPLEGADGLPPPKVNGDHASSGGDPSPPTDCR
jgi:hypothetical protein